LDDIQKQIGQLRADRLNGADQGQRTPTGKSPLTQTQRDNQKIEDRKRKLGSKFSAMQSHLKRNRQIELLWAADILVSRFGVEKVDRSGRRKLDGLICWYCEHVPDLLNGSPVLSEILASYHKPFLVSDISPDSQTESRTLPPSDLQMETRDSVASNWSFSDFDSDWNGHEW
jgi:hypothetical protein